MTNESKHLYMDKSSVNGTGLFSNKTYKQGDHISHIAGNIHVFRNINCEISKKMENWIGCGRYSWINTDKSLFRFINHSCTPNVVIIGKRTVRAIVDISIQEELTMDYSLTEAEASWGFNCACQSHGCRGFIGPIWSLDEQEFQSLKHLITPRFIKTYFNKPIICE